MLNIQPDDFLPAARQGRLVHTPGVEAHLTLHWLLILTFVPLACIAMAGLGLVLGTSFEPRNIGHMHLYVIYPVVAGFGLVFLAIGLRNFRRRALS
jgi:hypothetical protein